MTARKRKGDNVSDVTEVAKGFVERTLGKLVIPSEGGRKFVCAFWMLVSVVALTTTGHVTSDQFIEGIKWIGGFFFGGNAVEHAKDIPAKLMGALAKKGEGLIKA